VIFMEKVNPVVMTHELVSIKSSPDLSNKEIIDYLQRKFSGFETRIIPQKKGGLDLFNLIVKIPSKNRTSRPIVFLMHSDTVLGSWFNEVIEDSEKIVGLGAVDMKGAIASASAAAIEKEYNRDIYLVFSADEETTAKGVLLLKKELSIKEAIFIATEPSSHKILSSQNSIVSYVIETSGIQTHSSLATKEFNAKNNAIHKMIRVCNYFISLENSKKIAAQNIGVIQGGTASNIVSNKCVVRVSQRFTPKVDYIKESDKVRAKLLKLGATKVDFSFRGGSFSQKNKKLISKFEKITSKHMPVSVTNFPAWSEVGVFSNQGDCFIFGPGKFEDAHTVNESVLKSELLLFKKIYIDLILNL
jgi:acetylornithine deacetylase/succinyl-diaminopimelate desuccinylase-like protein